MDPSYNNAFDSFDSGAGQAPVVSSGGDVVVNSQPGRKSKKWLLLGVAILVLVGVAGLIALFILRGKADNVGSPAVKKAFNEYVNFVLNGSSSDSDVIYESLLLPTPYFETLEDEAEIIKYVQNANIKFDNFSKLYFENNGQYNIDILATYFQKFVNIPVMGEDEIVTDYKENGAEDTLDTIYQRYSIREAGEYLSGYILALRRFAELQLDFVIKSDENGCLGEVDCYVMSGEEEFELQGVFAELNRAENRMYDDAMEILDEVYIEIYGVGAIE